MKSMYSTNSLFIVAFISLYIIAGVSGCNVNNDSSAPAAVKGESQQPQTLPASSRSSVAQQNTKSTIALVADLFPVFMRTDFGYADSKYGYMDKTGKVIIQPQFDQAKDFSDGFAPARLGQKDNFGYINATGAFAIKQQFVDAKEFSEGLAAVMLDKKWGYIDINGSLVISPQFQDADSFSERLAPVMSGGKWGYIDTKGKFVIKPQFEGSKPALSISHDLAPSLIIQMPNTRNRKPALSFRDGLAPAFSSGKWGFIDRTGNFIIKPQFDEAGTFSDGLAPVLIENKWGFIDKEGMTVIKPTFDDAASFSEGLAKVGIKTQSTSLGTAGEIPWNLSVRIHNIYGFVDKAGEIIIIPHFEYAGSFQKGLAWVNTGESAKEGSRTVNREGYIDKKGAFVWNPTNKIEIELSDLERLFRQLRSQNLQQHFDAALGLVRIGKPAVPELVNLINDESWHVGVTSIWILGEIGDKDALDPLIEALQSKERIGPPGYTSYIGDMSFKPQKDLALYESPDSFPSWNLLFKRRAAAIALGNLGDKRAIEALENALREGPFSNGAEANVAIAKAIKKITGQPLPEDIEKELKTFSSYK